MGNPKFLNDDQIQKLKNISTRIVKVYEGVEFTQNNSSCLNSIRQCLEYLCLFTCEVYEIKITKRAKSGEIVENDNPTLGDMTPLIEKHFKENGQIWSKEVGMHIGSIWILGNLGSHAQKEHLENDEEINKATINNALNSMFIVTNWFYTHYNQACPIQLKHTKPVSDEDKAIIEKQTILYERIAAIKRIFEAKMNENTDIYEPNKELFKDIYFDDLLEAIELGQCVLFIGSDISVDADGNNLHDLFYKSISRRNIEFNEEDGFFMPKAEKQIELKALNYYGKKFHEENESGNKLLKKLAEIPFSLIISVTPDDTMHRIYDDFNKNHEFIYYNPRIKQQVKEPTLKIPVIFNMLGNTAIDGKYIYTHKQFYDYVNQKQEVKLPFEIETKIKDVAHYLFIGFDFSKWYNRLLLFTLNLYDEAEAYGLNKNIPKEIHIDFVNQQFNISFIQENYIEFVNVLHYKCEKLKITTKNMDSFIENTTSSISSVNSLSIAEANEILEKLEQKVAFFELEIGK